MLKIGVVIVVFLFLSSCSPKDIPAQETMVRVDIPEEKMQQEEIQQEVNIMKLTSPLFEDNGNIPRKYTCDGDNINPELQISNVPKGTASLVLIMDDPDIPPAVKEARGIQVFDHWVLFNIPQNIKKIVTASAVGTSGKNSAGQEGYRAPCPPPQYQPTTHRYFFKLYAVDKELDLPAGATKAQVEQAMHGHIIEQAELMGKYDRS